MIVLDGRLVASQHRVALQKNVQRVTAKLSRPPGLAVVLVGEDPASQVYVRNKIKECETVGIVSTPRFLSAAITQAQLESEIHALNKNASVDGILIQLPLPAHLNAEAALSVLDPKKDPDCLTAENVGRFFTGQARVKPCTPAGVMSILKHFQIMAAGKQAVVVGRSHIVGRPMAELLTQADATVVLCHSKTPDLKKFLHGADIAVVAAGRPKFVRATDFKKGAVVIDVGIHRIADPTGGGTSTKLCGDVDMTAAEGHLAALTPVPGGVGPMTIISLMENTLALAEAHVRG